MATIHYGGKDLNVVFVGPHSGDGSGSDPANSMWNLPRLTTMSSNTVYVLRRTYSPNWSMFTSGEQHSTIGSTLAIIGSPMPGEFLYDELNAQVPNFSLWDVDPDERPIVREGNTSVNLQFTGDRQHILFYNIVFEGANPSSNATMHRYLITGRHNVVHFEKVDFTIRNYTIDGEGSSARDNKRNQSSKGGVLLEDSCNVYIKDCLFHGSDGNTTVAGNRFGCLRIIGLSPGFSTLSPVRTLRHSKVLVDGCSFYKDVRAIGNSLLYIDRHADVEIKNCNFYHNIPRLDINDFLNQPTPVVDNCIEYRGLQFNDTARLRIQDINCRVRLLHNSFPASLPINPIYSRAVDIARGCGHLELDGIDIDYSKIWSTTEETWIPNLLNYTRISFGNLDLTPMVRVVGDRWSGYQYHIAPGFIRNISIKSPDDFLGPSRSFAGFDWLFQPHLANTYILENIECLCPDGWAMQITVPTVSTTNPHMNHRIIIQNLSLEGCVRFENIYKVEIPSLKVTSEQDSVVNATNTFVYIGEIETLTWWDNFSDTFILNQNSQLYVDSFFHALDDGGSVKNYNLSSGSSDLAPSTLYINRLGNNLGWYAANASYDARTVIVNRNASMANYSLAFRAFNTSNRDVLWAPPLYTRGFRIPMTSIGEVTVTGYFCYTRFTDDPMDNIFVELEVPHRSDDYITLDLASCGTIETDNSIWNQVQMPTTRKFVFSFYLNRLDPVYLRFGHRWNDITGVLYLDPIFEVS